MSRPIAALLVMLGCLLAAGRLPAVAAQPLSPKIANGGDAPFKILSCSATFVDDSSYIQVVR